MCISTLYCIILPNVGELRLVSYLEPLISTSVLSITFKNSMFFIWFSRSGSLGFLPSMAPIKIREPPKSRCHLIVSLKVDSVDRRVNSLLMTSTFFLSPGVPNVIHSLVISSATASTITLPRPSDI